jgi:tetratricopeptide (TPR) repeat protein
VDGLRDAVVACRETGETDLEAAALLALGAALIHATKGKDEEGAAALHRAVAVADRAGERAIAAAAHRELAYVEMLRGDYLRARPLLRSAEDLADGAEDELARIRAVSAAAFADVGAHDRAIAEFHESIRLSHAAELSKQEAWSLSVLGRTHLLRGDLEVAEEALTRARDLTKGERWTAFLAYPEALLGEVWVRQGDLDRAGERFEHAFALGSQVNDACWEAYGVRGLGLLRAARGDLDGAIATMDDALSCCARQHDTHLWLRAYVMDALCATAVAARHPMANRWITDLASIAGRAGMREFSVHAYLLRRELGDDAATEAARVLSVGVESPHLQSLVDAERASLLEDLLGKLVAS